jgi:site-specific DNA-cytosine methylase
MRYLSVCSGMEAASVAWHPLGWQPVGFSEIEPFPCAILKHRFPNTPNYGSLTEYKQWPLEPGAIDLLVGGTPCQSFSVAGLRKGLDDPRGNLALVFLGLADKLKPRWIVWENVPGVLSSNGGRDLGSFLGALVQLGYGFACECWTLNTSESRSVAVESSLSRVLETGVLPQRFFLSPTACAGILRRAERRGKALPPALKAALEQTAINHPLPRN